jgi:hypothetical protein
MFVLLSFLSYALVEAFTVKGAGVGQKALSLKQSVQFGVDLVDDLAEVIAVIWEVIMVGFNNKNLSQRVSLYPCLIPFIKPLKVVDPYRALIFPSPFLDLVYKCRYRGSEVKHQVGRLDK